MALDLDVPFGTDLNIGSTLQDLQSVLSNTADFSFITAREELVQRVIRRLLTNKGEWIPFPGYGASLRLRVNDVLTARLVKEIKAEIIGQITQEPDISKSPPPTVELTTIFGSSQLNVKVQFFISGGRSVAFSTLI